MQQHHISRLLASNLHINNNNTGFAYLNVLQSNEFSNYSIIDTNQTFDYSQPDTKYSMTRIATNNLNEGVLENITFQIDSFSNYFNKTNLDITNLSTNYNLLISSNTYTVQSNIHTYLNRTCNLSDVSNFDEALSNLGLDVFKKTQYNSNENSLMVSNDFVLQFGSKTDNNHLYFDFLNISSLGKQLNSIPILVSNVDNTGFIWDVIDFSNADPKKTVTKASSSNYGVIKIDT